ncbi:MAG: polyketide cyclase [Candidatus Eisenbacteria bacterium]|nr:polyketide cyclase [Candidatus Eisenbacteria bacterium]
MEVGVNRGDRTLELDPQAPVSAVAETRIAAPADVAWSTLADLNTWPDWNPDVEAMRHNGRVEPGSRFRWKAGGLSIASRFVDVVRPDLLSWTGRALGLRAAHRWTFTEVDGGTVVRTEETFDGLLTRIMPGKLRATLATSLEHALEALGRESERRARARGRD